MRANSLLPEAWADIPGYEGRYQVSNYGVVRSLPYARYQKSSHGTVMQKKYPGMVLAPQDNANGYKYVTLSNGEGRSNHYIHRLVAEAFIPNPEGRKEVNHIDYDKSNNAYWNLEWATRSENIHHSVPNMLVHRNHKLPESTGERYIRLRGGMYELNYCRNGKKTIYKSFRNLEDAKRMREVILSDEKPFAG